jgi:2-amino-4-hydroxy-6-hydroxymethyldihydropteridine diphosphokinase
MTAALWRPAYVAIGSNLDHPQRQVHAALAELGNVQSTRLILVSELYGTQPMGPQDQPDYVNAVAGMLTQLDARALLQALLAIESRMGRDRRERWGPRIIDLDLIWMSGPRIDEPGLQVPHPGVSTRNFVLYPLNDIAPSLEIPAHGRVSVLKARAGGAGINRINSSEQHRAER